MRILDIVEFLLGPIVIFALVIGALSFLIFGFIDVRSSYLIIGALGLMLFASNVLGIFALIKRKILLQLSVAVLIVVLSLAFLRYSPTRLGTLFGYGDPSQLAATWTGVTGSLLALVGLVLKFTGRGT
jgi:hypothetical protein